MPSPRPKPTALKKLQGTERKDRANPHEPKPPAGQLIAPSHLGKASKREYEQLAALLDPLRLVGTSDVDALCLLADAIVEYRRLAKIVASKGRIYTRISDRGGKSYAIRPEVTLRNDAWNRVMKGLVEFGMTPSSRTKVSARPTGTDDTATFLFGPPKVVK